MEAGTGNEDTARRGFDVFLAYNSRDEAAVAHVRAVYAALTARSLRPWLAERESIPGKLGTKAMADGIEKSACSAMFHGKEGLGTWQVGFELPTAIQKAVKDDDRLAFAVLLPGSDGLEALPAELQVPTVLDLRDQFQDGALSDYGIGLMVAAVRGISPREYEEQEAESRARAAAAAPPAGRNRALLVGVSEYDDAELKKLHGPHNDVTQLERALSSARMPAGGRWEITRCIEPSYNTLNKALAEFFGAEDAADDTVLFYYSGHGLVRDDSLLCVTDTQSRNPVFSSISSSRVAEMIRGCEARAKVLILDCCHAAPIAKNHYESLGEDVAVVLGSRGPAEDAAVVSEASPFTREVVNVLRDGAAYGPAGLTVRDMLTALEARGERPWTGAGGGNEILLAVGAAEQSLEPAERPEPITIDVPAELASSDRIPLVRQLSQTLDALLAVAGAEREIPHPVVRGTIEMLGEELRQLVLTPDDMTRIEAHMGASPERPPTLDLRFADAQVRAELADLPWEYLGFCRGTAEALPAAEDFMRVPPLSVERLVPSSPKKQVSAPSVQHVAIFSSLAPGDAAISEHHVLSATTKARLDMLGLSNEIVSAVTWGQFCVQRENADVVILHAPVHFIEGSVKVDFVAPQDPEPRRVPLGSVRDALKNRTALTWLFIEAVAEDPSKQPAVAVRRLAEELATKLERPVVAVCHARAYLDCLVRDETAATPFLAHLLSELNRRIPLDHAAHAARRRTVSTLATDEPAIVGIPIVIRPVPAKADESPRTMARPR